MDFKLLAGSTLGGGGVGDAAQAASLGIDTGCFPSLTMKQRIRGFVLCFGLGMLTSLLSSIYLTFANYTSFAVLYTFGNVLSMSSTALLFGPKRQVTNMFAKKRVLATIAYIVSLAATLVVAFTTGNAILTLVMVGIQFCALVWYTASYIPFARDVLKKMISSCATGGR